MKTVLALILPAALVLLSSAGLDINHMSEPAEFTGAGGSGIAYWRLGVLAGMGLMLGLIMLILVEYAIQLSEGKRKYVPVDRVFLLLSYMGFVSMVWYEVYLRYRLSAEWTPRSFFAGGFTVLGLLCLARKFYRVHFLIDEEKIAERYKVSNG